MSKEAAMEKIDNLLHKYYPQKPSGKVTDYGVAEEIDAVYQSLGYVQPNFSEDLERSIIELAMHLIQRQPKDLNWYKETIKAWFSANHLVQERPKGKWDEKLLDLRF